MSRLYGLALIIAGTFFFLNGDRFSHQAIEYSARQQRDERWRSPRWLQFTLWQGRVVATVLIVVGVLVLLGVVTFA